MDLESRVAKIEERNRAVALDKAWETSWTRRLLLSIFTYLAIALYLNAVSIPDPWLNAIVPALALMTSTLTMPWFKKLWADNRRKK